ncbi:MAG: hypothetical protein ACPLSN_07685 [Dictyoglomus turgidum]
MKKFEEVIRTITKEKDVTRLKAIAKEVYDDSSLTGLEKHAIISVYKARMKEIRTSYLKEAYENKEKKLFWALYRLIRHSDPEVRKSAANILYESDLPPVEKDILFSLYKGEKTEVESTIKAETTEETIEPF